VEVGNVRGGWIFFSKIDKRASTFIREMRVRPQEDFDGKFFERLHEFSKKHTI
jgi:hypothetical protein